MGTISAPAARGKRIDFPTGFTGFLRSVERFSGCESPLAQLAMIILAAAMASVVGTTVIKLLAITFVQS